MNSTLRGKSGTASANGFRYQRKNSYSRLLFHMFEKTGDSMIRRMQEEGIEDLDFIHEDGTRTCIQIKYHGEGKTKESLTWSNKCGLLKTITSNYENHENIREIQYIVYSREEKTFTNVKAWFDDGKIELIRKYLCLLCFNALSKTKITLNVDLSQPAIYLLYSERENDILNNDDSFLNYFSSIQSEDFLRKFKLEKATESMVELDTKIYGLIRTNFCEDINQNQSQEYQDLVQILVRGVLADKLDSEMDAEDKAELLLTDLYAICKATLAVFNSKDNALIGFLTGERDGYDATFYENTYAISAYVLSADIGCLDEFIKLAVSQTRLTANASGRCRQICVLDDIFIMASLTPEQRVASIAYLSLLYTEKVTDNSGTGQIRPSTYTKFLKAVVDNLKEHRSKSH